MFRVAPTSKKNLLGQFVNGKIETYDANVKCYRAVREIKELGITPANETPQQRQVREANIAEITAQLAADPRRLVQFYDGIIHDVHRGARPPAWLLEDTPGEDVTAALTLRGVRHLQKLRNLARDGLDFETDEILTVAELPPQRFYYHGLTAESRKLNLYRFFDDNVYQVFWPIDPVINLHATLQNNDVRDFMK